jgi:hypothetical protein
MLPMMRSALSAQGPSNLIGRSDLRFAVPHAFTHRPSGV